MRRAARGGVPCDLSWHAKVHYAHTVLSMYEVSCIVASCYILSCHAVLAIVTFAAAFPFYGAINTLMTGLASPVLAYSLPCLAFLVHYRHQAHRDTSVYPLARCDPQPFSSPSREELQHHYVCCAGIWSLALHECCLPTVAVGRQHQCFL
jgi:hypothetical protein